MYDEEKEEIKFKRSKRKKRIKERFKNSKKNIIIIMIIFIISLICSLMYNFLFKTKNKTNNININYGINTIFKTKEEFFIYYKKEINLKNEEFENNILMTNIIKNKLEERIIKENNTIIEDNEEINFTESNNVYLEAKKYINKIINTPFSFESLKNFSIQKNPKISIIITVYNFEEYLKTFIKNIDNQSII